jgi:hypothetical protein
MPTSQKNKPAKSQNHCRRGHTEQQQEKRKDI